MNERVGGSNVYYLSVGPAPGIAPEGVPEPGVPRRLRHAWWRLRLALTEIRAILLRPRRRPPAPEVTAFLALDPPAAWRSRARPATVIDFAAARARLRASD